MLKRPRRIYLLVLVIIYLICECDSGTTSAHPTTNNLAGGMRCSVSVH